MDMTDKSQASFKGLLPYLVLDATTNVGETEKLSKKGIRNLVNIKFKFEIVNKA